MLQQLLCELPFRILSLQRTITYHAVLGRILLGYVCLSGLVTQHLLLLSHVIISKLGAKIY